MATKNPYITGAPVGKPEVGEPNVFVGREDILQDLLDVVNSPDKNAIVLYGQRRIGKTSVLQKFENTLQEKKHLVVNFDLLGKAKEPFGEVWAELEKIIRDKFNQSGSHYEQGQPLSLDWLSTTLSEDNKNPTLVLLLDEFDALEEWELPEEQQAIGELFPRLRNLLNQHKNFKCVFTIGRDIKHLSSKTFSQLEGIEQRKISLLEEGQVVQLINVSKEELNWTQEAINKVERLTNGQAYCVQLLCSEIWDHFYSENRRPTISPQSVETVISQILSPAIFSEDIWEGLPAAGKVIASVLSEFDGGASIEQLLKETQERGGIASVIQDDLETVPALMVQWDLIELADNKYKFKVELIRLYIERFKPFDRMQPELDRLIDHAADDLYQISHKFVRQYQKYDDAIELLNKAIKSNPRHIKANQLLAKIYKDQGNLEDARNTLENFAKFNRRAAKPLLIDVLLDLAKNSKRDQDKLKFYSEILQLDSSHSEAKEQQQELQKRIEAKWHLPLELAKKFILAYQQRIVQVAAVVISLGILYIYSVDFPPGLLFEIGKTNNREYLLTSVPSSESHSLVFLRITIDKPNVQPKEVTFKFENYKPVPLSTTREDTETPTYQIDSNSTPLKLKGNPFQYPFFEEDKAMPLPFVFTFQFENEITQEPEFTCKTDVPKIDCEVRLKGYASLLRGIPWWIKGSLLGFLLSVFIWVFYAIKDRERDDVL